MIGRHYPEHRIVGEEGTSGTKTDAQTWIVDPLTARRTIPTACRRMRGSRSATRTGSPRRDLQPFREELFTVARGGGAWLGAERLDVSATAELGHALVCTGVQSDDEAAAAAFGRRILALSRHCRAVRCLGSPALCLAYVAAGRIDAFLEADSTYTWDVAAGALMITEAGGRIEDLGGGPLNLGRGSPTCWRRTAASTTPSPARAYGQDRPMTVAGKPSSSRAGGGDRRRAGGRAGPPRVDVVTADMRPAPTSPAT